MVKGVTDKGNIMVYHTPFLLKLAFFPFTKYKNDFLTIKPLGIKYNNDLIVLIIILIFTIRNNLIK